MNSVHGNDAANRIRIVLVEDDTRFRTAFAAAIEASGDLILQAQATNLRDGLALAWNSSKPRAARGPPATSW
jgi:DNA-binding NarL/FixJ family response regulator